jgi:hypothetical protein
MSGFACTIWQSHDLWWWYFTRLLCTTSNSARMADTWAAPSKIKNPVGDAYVILDGSTMHTLRSLCDAGNTMRISFKEAL